MDDSFSLLLTARPSFVEGVARTLDIWGTLVEYSTSPTAEEADAKALRSDWEAVGRDLQAAAGQAVLQRRG
jgi:hypothetical protein